MIRHRLTAAALLLATAACAAAQPGRCAIAHSFASGRHPAHAAIQAIPALQCPFRSGSRGLSPSIRPKSPADKGRLN